MVRFYSEEIPLMKEKCPICDYLVNKGATKCKNCGFEDERGINREWLNKEDANYWLETSVRPYRMQWEAWKRVIELSAQLEEGRKSEAVLLTQIEEYHNKEKDISVQLEAARKKEMVLAKELEEMKVKKSYTGMADTTPSKEKASGNSSGKIVNDGLVIVHRDWLYYCSKNNLYKIRTDGTGKQKLNNDWCKDFNVVGDWVYYCNMNDNDNLYNQSKLLGVANSILQVSGKLFRIRTNGTGRQKLSDDWCTDVNITGDWINYCNMSDNFKHYKIRTDGTDRQIVD
jgi:hypothetical protein